VFVATGPAGVGLIAELTAIGVPCATVGSGARVSGDINVGHGLGATPVDTRVGSGVLSGSRVAVGVGGGV
jgi:hypothetical protein